MCDENRDSEGLHIDVDMTMMPRLLGLFGDQIERVPAYDAEMVAVPRVQEERQIRQGAGVLSQSAGNQGDGAGV